MATDTTAMYIESRSHERNAGAPAAHALILALEQAKPMTTKQGHTSLVGAMVPGIGVVVVKEEQAAQRTGEDHWAESLIVSASG
jgi:hypothetical protein